MPAILKLCALCIWMALLPCAAGLLPCLALPAAKRTFPRIAVTGFLLTFAVFEIIAIPVLLYTKLGDFELLVQIYSAALLLIAAGGMFGAAKTGGTAHLKAGGMRSCAKGCGTGALLWAAFAALLCFELFMAYSHASFDGDDAYYVTQSVLTYQTGTMYRYLPYTGITTEIDFRHALAMLPMWTAAVGRLCRTHPAIIAHSMQPLLFIPLADLVYYRIARELFRDREEKHLLVPAFMVIIALLQIFGNVSIYTPETFLLTRTWQGKTLLANFLIPCGILSLLLLSEDGQPAENTAAEGYLLAFLVCAASGLFTSMAPPFAALLLTGGTFVVDVIQKKPHMGRFVRILALCAPAYLYTALYLALR